MNAETLAKKLNGVEYRNEVSEELRQKAKENRLVIVYGASDDLLEFDGAIYDEIGAWDGCECYVNEHGEISMNDGNGGQLIEAIWCPEYLDTSWEIKTDIPSFAFDVMEDGKLYCRSLVFSLDDIKPKN